MADCVKCFLHICENCDEGEKLLLVMFDDRFEQCEVLCNPVAIHKSFLPHVPWDLMCESFANYLVENPNYKRGDCDWAMFEWVLSVRLLLYEYGVSGTKVSRLIRCIQPQVVM